MTDREKYIMPLNEIQALIAGFIQYGADETYDRMKSKALQVMDKSPDLDEEFLDRSETLLQRAREEEHEKTTGDEISLREIYYTLSFMLKKLAHEIHFIYAKKDKKKESNRFLRVISNKDAPKLLL